MTGSPLDLESTYARDPAGLYGRIVGLPEQLRSAYAAAREMALPQAYTDARSIALLGMGGSGIGGGLLQALALELGAAAPVFVVRGYRLPGHVDASTLAIASSNSGNTEEVLALAEQAVARGAPCVAITTGGRLGEFARARGIPSLLYAWQGEPRSALGWSFGAPLALCARMGLFGGEDLRVDEALAAMRDALARCAREVPAERNPAKQLAARVAGRLPVIVGSGVLAAAAYRWRTQFNENGKTWAVAEELPEMNHNAPVGFAQPDAVAKSAVVLLLRGGSTHPRVVRRIALTLEQLGDAGVEAMAIDIPGATPLAELLGAAALGDMVSYYTGLLNGADPAENRALDWLKERMASD